MSNLKRFVDAQEPIYSTVLKELENGKKLTHWIWFIFPQLKGIGVSENAIYYGLDNKEEAQDYFDHPILGPRLSHCCKVLLESEEDDIIWLLGIVDAIKLKACLTLFSEIVESPFKEVLEKFY